MTMVLPKRNDEGTELREAATALKGMLGIATAATVAVAGVEARAPSASHSTSASTSAPIVAVVENVPSATSSTSTSTGTKAAKKNKKKKKAKQQQSESGTPVVSPNKPPKSTAKQVSQGSNKKGKKKNANATANANSNKYAWSAFQASPDASSLPLPVFQEVEDSKAVLSDDIVPQGKKVNEQVNANVNAVSTTQDESISACEVKTLTTKDTISNKDLLNKLLSTKVDTPSRNDVRNAEDETRDLGSEIEEKLKVNDETGVITSSSGVNLAAALIESSSSTKTNSKPSIPQSFLQQQPHPLPNSSPPQLMPNIGHPYGPPPPQMHHQHMITIQVQVPENNGYMMVSTPAGFPIPVQVPPGVRPGMIIPVNVPMPLSPPGSSHMPMPMNGHYQYTQPMMHPQYPPHSSPHQANTGPRPGSWAAAALKPEQKRK